MVKSALDAGWSSINRALDYNCASAGVIYQEIYEAYSTRTFQGVVHSAGPKGLKNLVISGHAGTMVLCRVWKLTRAI